MEKMEEKLKSAKVRCHGFVIMGAQITLNGLRSCLVIIMIIFVPKEDAARHRNLASAAKREKVCDLTRLRRFKLKV